MFPVDEFPSADFGRIGSSESEETPNLVNRHRQTWIESERQDVGFSAR